MSSGPLPSASVLAERAEATAVIAAELKPVLAALDVMYAAVAERYATRAHVVEDDKVEVNVCHLAVRSARAIAHPDTGALVFLLKYVPDGVMQGTMVTTPVARRALAAWAKNLGWRFKFAELTTTMVPDTDRVVAGLKVVLAMPEKPAAKTPGAKTPGAKRAAAAKLAKKQ